MGSLLRGALQISVNTLLGAVTPVTAHLKSKPLSFPEGFALHDEDERARYGGYASTAAPPRRTLRALCDEILDGKGGLGDVPWLAQADDGRRFRFPSDWATQAKPSAGSGPGPGVDRATLAAGSERPTGERVRVLPRTDHAYVALGPPGLHHQPPSASGSPVIRVLTPPPSSKRRGPGSHSLSTIAPRPLVGLRTGSHFPGDWSRTHVRVKTSVQRPAGAVAPSPPGGGTLLARTRCHRPASAGGGAAGGVTRALTVSTAVRPSLERREPRSGGAPGAARR